MKSKTVAASIVTALLILMAAQLFAQSTPNVGNSSNPPAFQKFAAPISSRLAFLASEKGKQVLLGSPNPLARELLMKYHGADAAALWDKIPHKYATAAPPSPAADVSPQRNATPIPKRSPGASSSVTTRCPATQFNLEPAAGAMPQNTVTIDFQLGGASGGGDLVVEGSNDWRGLFDTPAQFSPSFSGYYFETLGGCVPQFEGGLPPIPDPWYPATRMWGMGDPILNYAGPIWAGWFYSSVFEDERDSAVGVFRNTTANLSNSLTCPAGTHNLAASIACWPLSLGAVIVDEESSSYEDYVDKPDSWVDSRTTGVGDGNVYITATHFTNYGTSYINLTACNNVLTECSYPETINPSSDTATQFSDVKTAANGNITITYGNYTTEVTASQYRYINEVDIKYVVCLPTVPPAQPPCGTPVLVASEWQPVNILAGLTDVRNNTYPVHVETANGTYVFWERCGSYSDLPFGGYYTSGGWTCPDADIVGAFSSNGGTSWTAPFVVDNTFGHQIMPWATYDPSIDKITIAYQNCNAGGKTACQAGYRTITPSGSTTVSAFNAVSSYAYPEADANRGWFEPLFGDYIGAAAHTGGTPSRSTLWIGYSDTRRYGLYGFGTELVKDSNNNVAALDNY
jgi:hypothetical protein